MKLNAWRMTLTPNSVFVLKGHSGFGAGKKIFSNYKNVGWYPVKDGIGYLGDRSLIPNEDIMPRKFIDFDRNYQESIIHSRLKDYFSSYGFVYNKRSDLFFLPKTASKNAAIYSPTSNLYINIGFKYSIERVGNHHILVINPYQVTTEDGNAYSSKFSRINNAKILSDPILKPTYSKLVQTYSQVCKIISTDGKIEVLCGDSGKMNFTESKKVSLSTLKEPQLYFGAGKFDYWPKLGLNKYGPLDANIGKAGRPNHIEVAFIGSKNSFDLLVELKNGGKKGTYPYKGFDTIFRSSLAMGKERFCKLIEAELLSVSTVEEIAELLISKVVEILNKGISIDIALIELPDEWAEFYVNQDIDLHDLIKVKAWQHNISTQLFLKSDFSSSDNTDLLNNLGLGIYHKSKGEPWRVETKYPDCAYIGISFGFSISESKRLIGVAEIFDCYGQFVALRSMTIKEKLLENNFNSQKDLHLLPNQLSDLVTKLLHDYYRFMGSTYPDHLIIHKTSYFNKNEMADIEQLTAIPTSITPVYTQSRSNWHLIGQKIPTRGTTFKLSTWKAILYTSGILQGQSNYFLPGAPKPYLINLQGESNFTVEEIMEQIMELSKLNFNSTNTYSKHPVSLLHSKKIVNLLRAGLPHDTIPSDPRFFV